MIMDKLRWYQTEAYTHPLTCGKEKHTQQDDGEVILEPVEQNGGEYIMRCPICGENYSVPPHILEILEKPIEELKSIFSNPFDDNSPSAYLSCPKCGRTVKALWVDDKYVPQCNCEGVAMCKIPELSWHLYKEGDYWVAQCLEYDITTQSKWLNNIGKAIVDAVKGHIAISKELGEIPFESIATTPISLNMYPGYYDAPDDDMEIVRTEYK